MQFKVLKQSKKSRARLGIINTPHGVLHTPAFFPVATQACLKTLTSEDIKDIGYEGVLANTYHLYLRPGHQLIKKMGGLHSFMNFPGVISTDSGGFQVFSLGQGLEHGVGKIAKIFPGTKGATACTKNSLVKIREEGVYFSSHLDGQKHFLSPEKSIEIQLALGSDIMFAFDECTSPLADQKYTALAMERTHRWAERCMDYKKKGGGKTSMASASFASPHLRISAIASSYELRATSFELRASAAKEGLFGIIQGGEYKNLRQKSAQFIGSLDFDGFGIGGSLGKTKNKMYEILDWTIPLLPQEKPRHLLGIGYLEDFKKAIQKGIDLFDCVYPTRFARHGVAITSLGNLNINKASFLTDKKPLDKKCACLVCQNYSRSYICHLFRAKEITAMRLLTYHNLYFFRVFMDNIRRGIAEGKI